jgi:hypothetical protein
VRRLVWIFSIFALFGVFSSPSASARGPKWEFLPSDPLVVTTSCSFPVALDFPRNMEFGKATENPDGSVDVRITGSLHVSATNIESGETVTVNASGPGFLHISPDGSLTILSHGLAFAWFLADEVEAFGLPSAMFVWSGQLQATVDADGNDTDVTLHGHMHLDVCATLS